jgi:hypothetical protein
VCPEWFSLIFSVEAYHPPLPAIPGERQTPITTAPFWLPFRKHQCENAPLTETI